MHFAARAGCLIGLSQAEFDVRRWLDLISGPESATGDTSGKVFYFEIDCDSWTYLRDYSANWQID